MARKVVTVIWGDAHSNNNELTEAEILAIHRPTIVRTTGQILKSDEVGVSIVGEHLPAMRGDEYDSFRSHTFIPRAMVIQEGEKKRARLPKKTNIQKVPINSGDSPVHSSSTGGGSGNSGSGSGDN
jgi:hypothetical protein